MFSYWIKNRFLFTLVLSAILTVVIGMFFVLPNIKSENENSLKTSVYQKSDIDFDIPSPSIEQLAEINSLEFVDAVFGYYYTETTIKANGKNINQKVIFSDCMDMVEITMFNKERLIEQGSGSYSNPIYVDREFIKKSGVSIGDEIELGAIKFQVASIYETNTYNGAILAPLIGEQKALIEGNNSSYSGAFLKVNDYSKADSYLRNYKPFGRLKEKSSFDNEEEYNIHYSAWDSANYYNEVTSFKGKLEGINLVKTTSVWVVIGIYAVIAVLINIILFIRKSEKKYFREKKSKKNIGVYYFLTFVLEVITACGCSAVVGLISIHNEEIMITQAIRTECSIIVIGFIVVAIVNYIINNMLLKTIANENK